MNLAAVYYRNALLLLADERRTARRINDVYVRLSRLEVRAGVEDFLSNPYISTALSILRSFTKSYKVQQALKLLEEAGEEATKEKEAKKKRR